MSVRRMCEDGSSERLMDSGASHLVEDEDVSLASLLGISDKDVVSLDDDHTETMATETELLIDDSSGMENDDDIHGVQRERKDENGSLDETDATVDVFEINADKEVCAAEVSVGDEHDVNDGTNGEGDFVNDSNNDSDGDKKNDSRVDFRKLFGFSSSGRHEQPDTSYDDFRVELGDVPATDTHKLITPEPPVSRRPISPVIMDRREREQRFLKKQVSQFGKLLCGIVITVFLLCLTMGMLAMGYWFGIPDLYIIGGIFGGGTVVFFIIFIFIRCTTNSSVEYITLYKVEPSEKKA